MSGWTDRITLVRIALGLIAGLAGAATAWAEAAAVFSATGPDAAAHGSEARYPPPPPGVRPSGGYLVGYHSRVGDLARHNLVRRAPSATPLRRAAAELKVTYEFRGRSHTIIDYLDRHPVTGLLIARGDTIHFEHYRYARTDHDRLLSQSMAKTVTAMLVGIAVAEGAIRSIDQVAAEYVPDLSGSSYGQTSIRHLLLMASGVRWVERYDGNDDNARLGRGLFGANSPGAARVLAQFNDRDAAPGTRFQYASAETEVLGLVLTAATGMPAARYLETRIWQPMGAEADATWMTDRQGQEATYCCLSAVLRDWARFALLLAHDGAWNGRQIVPRAWIHEATTASVPPVPVGQARPRIGYGYQTWLQPGTRRQFSLRGIHGQVILIDPSLRLILVHTAARPRPSGDTEAAAELTALWNAIVSWMDKS